MIDQERKILGGRNSEIEKNDDILTLWYDLINDYID